MLQPGAARDSMRMPSASFSSFQPSSAIADAATPATSSANGRLSSARRRMSDLAGRQTHDQTVERIAHRDLPGQPAGRFRIQLAVEHHFLFLGLRADLGGPCTIDITVTGRTCTADATLAEDARQPRRGRPLQYVVDKLFI